jgi:hypothetical protein
MPLLPALLELDDKAGLFLYTIADLSLSQRARRLSRFKE